MADDNELEVDDEAEVEQRIPDCSMDEDEVEALDVEYSIRAPEDWVVSGPLGRAIGPGRRFKSWGAAERWAREFYGARFKGRVGDDPEATRWAFLVKGPRGSSV